MVTDNGELLNQIVQLAKESEPVNKGASCILYALAGAIGARQENILAFHTTELIKFVLKPELEKRHQETHALLN